MIDLPVHVPNDGLSTTTLIIFILIFQSFFALIVKYIGKRIDTPCSSAISKELKETEKQVENILEETKEAIVELVAGIGTNNKILGEYSANINQIAKDVGNISATTSSMVRIMESLEKTMMPESEVKLMANDFKNVLANIRGDIQTLRVNEIEKEVSRLVTVISELNSKNELIFRSIGFSRVFK